MMEKAGVIDMCMFPCANVHVSCNTYIHVPETECSILQSAAQAKKQMVTEAERELLRSGKFDELVEEQRRIDAERDAEVQFILHSSLHNT